jgi:hypothetical protein
MDVLLGKVCVAAVISSETNKELTVFQVTQQAMNYAIRTGITITSGYAIRQCGRLLKVSDST